MFRATLSGFCSAALSLLLAMPAWAQDAVCPDGESCTDTYHWGAWGLIAIGLLFCVIGIAPGPRRDEESTYSEGLPFVSFLQARIEKETTGWRRWQWPLLGVCFIGLGVSFLVGWQ